MKLFPAVMSISDEYEKINIWLCWKLGCLNKVAEILQEEHDRVKKFNWTMGRNSDIGGEVLKFCLKDRTKQMPLDLFTWGKINQVLVSVLSRILEDQLETR